jgi:hypothetical protein
VRVIEIDGRSWRSIDDLYGGLFVALDAPAWHGRNINALIDSMGTGSINGIEPPYLLKIRGVPDWPSELRVLFRDFRKALAERADDHFRRHGERRVIEIVTDSDF